MRTKISFDPPSKNTFRRHWPCPTYGCRYLYFNFTGSHARARAYRAVHRLRFADINRPPPCPTERFLELPRVQVTVQTADRVLMLLMYPGAALAQRQSRGAPVMCVGVKRSSHVQCKSLFIPLTGC